MPVTLERPASFADKLAAEMKPLEAQKLAEAGQAPAKPAAVTEVKPTQEKPATTEPKPVDFEAVDKEIVEGKRKPYAEDFKRIKHAADEGWKKAREFEPKVQQYEKELADLKKAPKHNAELIKQITEERDRYKGMFEQVAVEISPEFHAKYAKRLESVKVGLPADQADKLMSLLTLPDSDVKRKHLAEVTSEMDEFQVAEVVAANREVRTILNERQGELNKSQEALGKIGEERTKKQQERQTTLAKTFEDVIAKAKDQKDGNPVFQAKEGDEGWNKSVNERADVAKAIFNGEFESDGERAEASLWAAAAPEFLSQLKTLAGELASARETISKMQGASPVMNGAGSPGPTGSKMTYAQKVDAEMRGNG